MFPSRRRLSNFGARVLNFRVRKGNGWNHSAIATGLPLEGSEQLTRPFIDAQPTHRPRPLRTAIATSKVFDYKVLNLENCIREISEVKSTTY